MDNHWKDDFLGQSQHIEVLGWEVEPEGSPREAQPSIRQPYTGGAESILRVLWEFISWLESLISSL